MLLQTPKQVDETCKTPREAKKAAKHAPPLVHVEATTAAAAAADPAKHEDPGPKAAAPATPPAAPAPEQQQHADAALPQAPELKPLQEVSLQAPAAPAHPAEVHAQHSSLTTEAEAHAEVQDQHSAQHAKGNDPATQHEGPAGHTATVKGEEALHEAAAAVEPHSRLTTQDGVTTLQSVCSNYSGKLGCMCNMRRTTCRCFACA